MHACLDFVESFSWKDLYQFLGGITVRSGTHCVNHYPHWDDFKGGQRACDKLHS